MCRSASIDQQTNSVSLFNVVEELTINKAPLGNSIVKKLSNLPTKTQIKTDFTFVVHMERDPEVKIQKFNPGIKIKVVSPSGDTFAEAEVPLKFEAGKNRLRAIINMGTFPVKDSGLYKIVVSTRVSLSDDFEEVEVVPVDVKIYE